MIDNTKDIKQLEPSYIAAGSVEYYECFGKQFANVILLICYIKTNVYLHKFAILPLVIYPRKMKPHVHTHKKKAVH